MSSPDIDRPPFLQRCMIHLTIGFPLLWLTMGAGILFAGVRNVEPIAGIDVRVVVGGTVLLGGLVLVSSVRRRLDGLAALLWVMLLQGSLVGAFHLVDGSQAYRASYYWSHLAAGALMLVGYRSFSRLSGDFSDWLIRVLDWYSVCTLLAMAPYLVAFTLDWLKGGRYWGPSTGPLLLPAAWFAVRGRWRLALLAGVMIVINGKRGPAVALLAEWLILAAAYWDVWSWRLRRRAIRWAVVLGVAVAGAASWAVVTYDPETSPAMLVATVNKWQTTLPDGPDFDYNEATAGRLTEVVAAYKSFTASQWHWVMGTGYGWSFIDPTRGSLHYLHLSPLNLLIQYGLVAFVLFMWLVYRHVSSAIWVAQRKYTPVSVAYLGVAVTVCGALVDGLFSYMYAVSPWIWIGLGLLAADRRRRRLPSSARGTAQARPALRG